MGTSSSSDWGIFGSYRQRVQSNSTQAIFENEVKHFNLDAITNDDILHRGEQPGHTYMYALSLTLG